MFMKFSRKSSALSLVCVLLILLSACNGGAKPSVSTSIGSSQSSVKPVLKLVRLEATVAVPNGGNETQLVEKYTGYKVNIEYYDAATSVQKITLAMAGGEEIDLVLPGTKTTDIWNQMPTMIKNNAVYELGALMDKAAPDLLKAFSSATWDSLKIDGKIYGMPMETFDIPQNGDVIRIDLLEKLNLPIPKTLDELVTVLKLVKEKDPAGVGKNNVIPLSMNYPGNAATNNFPFRAQFGISYNFNNVNGKIVSVIQMPALKEYIKFMKKLYDEGLLDKDFLVTKMDGINPKILSNQIFMFSYAHWTNMYGWRDAIDKAKSTIKLAYLPMVTGPYGDNKTTSSYGLSMGGFIPKTSKHPEDVIRYLAEWAKPDVFKVLMQGEEGIDNKVVNGEVYPILPSYNDRVGNMNFLMPLAKEDVYFKYWLPRTRKLPLVESSFSECYATYKNSTFRDPLAYAMGVPAYTSNRGKLDTLLNEYIAKAILGQENLDSYDKFVEKWLNAGGTDTLKALNEWYAKNK